MAPEELIPRPKNELSLGKANPNEITSRMAEDLLAIRKDEVLEDAVVHFKCKNLEKALREQIDIPDRPIFRQDLKNFVGKIFLSWRPLFGDEITDITPLKDMTQLRVLFLSGNQISDLTPLQGMTQLQRLHLFKNQICDLSPLHGMTQLQRLVLDTNQISDLSPLKEMTQLRMLKARGNQISDLSPLHGMTQLQWLWLRENKISESEIAKLKEALPNCRIY